MHKLFSRTSKLKKKRQKVIGGNKRGVVGRREETCGKGRVRGKSEVAEGDCNPVGRTTVSIDWTLQSSLY